MNYMLATRGFESFEILPKKRMSKACIEVYRSNREFDGFMIVKLLESIEKLKKI